jgi:hypothetical protein
MRLQLNVIEIKDIEFSGKTALSSGRLFIDREELRHLILQDTRLAKVDIELAHPGEKCRILQVCDVVEPRAKVGGEGVDFPGALGEKGVAGQGTTCVLQGCSVVTTLYAEEVEGPRDPNGEIIDMSGPGAELTPYGHTHTVLLLPFPGHGNNQQ